MRVLVGMFLPFLGTSAGALAVYLLRGRPSAGLQAGLQGFAAGVMTAASVWSLLLPAIERSEALGCFAFMPAAGGFWMGLLLLRLLDHLTAGLQTDGRQTTLSGGTRRMLLAITLHNLPEGMAVGAAFAAAAAEGSGTSLAGAMALSAGIAVQNLPEGAIVSMPLHAAGRSKRRACGSGVLSGAIEPVGAALTFFAARWLSLLLPWVLSLAAGAMLLVVMEELAPPFLQNRRASALFALGFTLMMALDVALS